MSNVHRIMWLDQQIRQGKYPNCRKLAEHFEISLRQANRDLEYLRSTLNAPISYVAAKRGYIYDDMTYILPNLVITAEERKALSFLAYRYDNYDGTEYSQRIANLFRNLAENEAGYGTAPIFPISDEKITLFHKLKECIRKRKKIDISYLLPNGEPVRLILHPYRIYGKADIDYLLAYCEEYADLAVFRLDRIQGCTESSHTYIKRHDIPTEQYAGLLKKKPFRAILKAAPELKPSNLGDKITKLENGLYEVEFYDANQFIRELMISDQWTEVSSPAWLCDKIKSRCQKILDQLQPAEPV